MRLGLQPVANDAGALLSILWPRFREAEVGDVVALDESCYARMGMNSNGVAR